MPANSNIISINKKAKFEYHIIEKFQAGLALNSYQVKAIRSKDINPDRSYIIWQKDKLEIVGLGAEGKIMSVPILLNKPEVEKIKKYIKEKTVTCVLLNFKKIKRWIKADIAVVRGKNKADKRETIKARDLARDKQRGID